MQKNNNNNNNNNNFQSSNDKPLINILELPFKKPLDTLFKKNKFCLQPMIITFTQKINMTIYFENNRKV